MCSVGSRFCNSAESNYSPTDGEFTALVDALEKTAYFTLGCSDLTVGTDHKPLISIVNETSLGDIKTPRQQRLKERLMRWNLTATYIPGKLLGGTDALSRYGIRNPSDETAYRIFNSSLATATEERSLAAVVSDLPPVTASDLAMATDGDKDLAKLRCYIHGGFPETKPQMPVSIQPYWRVRDMLTEHGGVVYMGDRTVVPESLRGRVLSTLHSAHQGTTSMRLRAEKNMFWPNMAADIANTRNHCTSCDA